MENNLANTITSFPAPRIPKGEYVELAQQVSEVFSKYSYHNANSVKIRIHNAIKSKSPFSLIRLGDGEGRILAYPDLIDRKELSLSLNIWFGKAAVLDDHLEKINLALINSIKQADLIGIPSPELIRRVLPQTILGQSLIKCNYLAIFSKNFALKAVN